MNDTSNIYMYRLNKENVLIIAIVSDFSAICWLNILQFLNNY